MCAPQEHWPYKYKCIPGLRFNWQKVNSKYLTVLVIPHAAATAVLLANFLLIRTKHHIQR